MPRPSPIQTAVVTDVAVNPNDPRMIRIRPERGGSDAPAYFAPGVDLTLGVGARVLFEQVGSRLVVRSGA